MFGLGICFLDVVNLLFLLGDSVDVLAVSFTVMRYSGLLAEVSVTGSTCLRIYNSVVSISVNHLECNFWHISFNVYFGKLWLKGSFERPAQPTAIGYQLWSHACLKTSISLRGGTFDVKGTQLCVDSGWPLVEMTIL